MSEPSYPPPKTNRIWLYFFAFLIVASVGVCVFMIWFNLSIQLKPDQLEAAWDMWKAKKVKNYNMVYTKQIKDGTPIAFAVKVRDERVVEVRMDGKPLEKDQIAYHSMDRLFDDIERFLTMDQKPDARKVYAIARFDPQTGALLHYVRRVMGTNERVELNVKVETLD